MLENLFGENGLGGFLGKLSDNLSQQQSIDERAAGAIAREKSQLVEDSSRYQAATEKAAGELDKINAAGDEARRLAESGNIFDRIQLIGEQVLNPRDFTREARTARTAEVNQGLAAEAQILGAKSQATNLRLDEIQAQHTLETLRLGADMNRIKGIVAGSQMAAQALVVNEQLRTFGLTKVELPAIQQALAGPKNPNGKVTINGFEYSDVELRERAKELDVREKLSLLSPQATDPQYAAKLNTQHQLMMAGMKAPELEAIKQNGYRMSDGTQVDPAIWEDAYNREQRVNAAQTERIMREQQVQFMVPSALDEGQKILDATQQFNIPGSKINSARITYMSTLAAAAGLEEEAKKRSPDGTIDNGTRYQQLTLLEKAKANYFSEIQSEAMRKAGGDKTLGDLYFKQFTGQPIDPTEIRDSMRTRYIDKKGLGSLLDGESTERMRKKADQISQDMRIQQAQNMNLDAVKLNESTIREQAFNQAFEEERSRKAAILFNAKNQQLSLIHI